MSSSSPFTAETQSNRLYPDRLQIESLIDRAESAQIEQDAAQDVIQGLSQTPKTLPPRYLYDDRGSQLFEQICQLPEYYLTRTETAILQDCAAEIAQTTGACDLVELGSGSAIKTRILLDAYQAKQYPLRYLPIDVSASILEASALDLLNDYPSLHIQGLISTYQKALTQLPAARSPTRMICFIGSTLGNLSPDACVDFFAQITTALRSGEYFLLGIDLQKSKSVLEAAYNDSQGITAAFNLNMLRHLNQKFDGNFDLSQFQHESFYNDRLNRIEMHLRSLTEQTVTLNALNFSVPFQAGETILSEISRKFNLSEMRAELAAIGLPPLRVWTDSQTWFALLLCRVE